MPAGTIEASEIVRDAAVAAAPVFPPPQGASETRFQVWAKQFAARYFADKPNGRYPVEALTFGVEVECYTPSRWIQSNSIPVGSYTRPYLIDESAGFPAYSWKAATDASLDSAPSGHSGVEYKTIPLCGPAGVAALIEGVRNLGSRGANAIVNKTCGLHIHVGIPDATRLDVVRRLVAMCARFERTLYATTGSILRENSNSYCVPIRDKVKASLEKRTWNRRDLVMAQNGSPYDDNGEQIDTSARGYMGNSKYSSVNFSPLIDGRGTVEFRLFAGTLNVGKVLGHLACALGIVQKALSSERSVSADGWTPDTTTPATSAAALMESWRSFQVSMGWIGSNRPLWGWIEPPTSANAPTLARARRKLGDMVKQYAIHRFGTTGANAAEENEDLQGE